jgi:TrpR family trp operon transcriptional repressor
MVDLSDISKVLTAIRNPSLMGRFLEVLLTPREIDNLVKRWELIRRLDRGMSQRAIAKELNLSLCKITRGSRELKKKGSPLKKVLKMRGE